MYFIKLFEAAAARNQATPSHLLRLPFHRSSDAHQRSTRPRPRQPLLPQGSAGTTHLRGAQGRRAHGPGGQLGPDRHRRLQGHMPRAAATLGLWWGHAQIRQQVERGSSIAQTLPDSMLYRSEPTV